MSRYGMALGLMLTVVLAGCVSTDALYAEYDEVCPVQARVTDTGMVMVSAIASGGQGKLWEPAVYFGYDQHQLSAEARARLDRNLRVLEQYPVLQLAVQAFTDQKGSSAYNRRLAEKRVQQVRQYLQEKGLAAGRIQAAAVGKEMPILTSDSTDDRIINRRVELMLLDAQGRPLRLLVDVDNSGGDSFVAPGPVR